MCKLVYPKHYVKKKKKKNRKQKLREKLKYLKNRNPEIKKVLYKQQNNLNYLKKLTYKKNRSKPLKPQISPIFAKRHVQWSVEDEYSLKNPKQNLHAFFKGIEQTYKISHDYFKPMIQKIKFSKDDIQSM